MFRHVSSTRMPPPHKTSEHVCPRPRTAFDRRSCLHCTRSKFLLIFLSLLFGHSHYFGPAIHTRSARIFMASDWTRNGRRQKRAILCIPIRAGRLFMGHAVHRSGGPSECAAQIGPGIACDTRQCGKIAVLSRRYASPGR